MVDTISRETWLLINYNSPSSIIMWPIGLAYISSALKTDPRLSVHFIDLALIPMEEYGNSIIQTLSNTQAGVVGIGAFSRDFVEIKKIVLLIRHYNPAIIIVGGGPIVTSDPCFIHQHLDLDYGVVGEGEETVLELANHLLVGTPPQGIDGLVFRDQDGKSINNRARKAAKHIDEILWPDWEGLGLGKYLARQSYGSKGIFNSYMDSPVQVPIVFSRSCPYKCTFCTHAVSSYRLRNFDSAFQEVDALLEKYQANSLEIYDDLFAVSRKRLEEFCKRIEPYHVYWMAQIRIDFIDEALLAQMRKANCYMASYGFESMDATVLKSMRKKIVPAQIEKVARLTYEAHIAIQGNFIFGDRLETSETADNTLNWWANNRRYAIGLSMIGVYPGSELFQTAIHEGKLSDPYDFLLRRCPIINVSQLSDHEFHGLMNEILSASYPIPAHVSFKISDGMIDITAVCPHCGQTKQYPLHMCYNVSVLCHYCRGSFIMDVRKIIGPMLYSPDNIQSIQQAIQYYYEEKYLESIQLANQVITNDRTNHVAYCLAGTAYLKMGMSAENLQNAKINFRAAISQAQTCAEAHNNLGILLCLGGHFGWALLRFQQALAIDPSSPAMVNLQKVKEFIMKDHSDIPFVKIFPIAAIMEVATGLMIANPQINTSSPVHWPPLRADKTSPLAKTPMAITNE